MMEIIESVWLPQALSIDIGYETFWLLSPRKLEPFLESHKMKQAQQNKIAWLNGIYVSHAISAAFSKNHKYPSEPIEINPSVENKISDEEKFAMWASVANKDYENKVNGEL